MSTRCFCFYSFVFYSCLQLAGICFASSVNIIEESQQAMQLQKISRLDQIHITKNPKQHYVFFDIDGVLLSQGGTQSTADLISSPTLQSIIKLQEQGGKCFALTARSTNQMVETFQRLHNFGLNFIPKHMDIDFLHKSAQYFKGIIFSPNVHNLNGKISTKLVTLKAFVDHLENIGQKVSTVSFIDNESFHFEKDKIANFGKDLNLYHYEREFEPLHSTFKNTSPPAFAELKFEKICSGGTGGVAVFQDKTSKKWTIKSWQNKSHGINECLASWLYQQAGGCAPDFFLFNDLPESIQQQLKDNPLHKGGLYRLAEFIEGRTPTEQELKQHLKANFTSLAWLSFWDIKPDNFIITSDNKLHLIDTGGSLLYHSLGAKKKAQTNDWLRYQISELQTLRQGNTFGAKYFSDVQNNELKQQIKSLLQKSQTMLEQAREFCRDVRYVDTQEVLQSLEARLQHLQFLDHFLDGKINKKADPYAFASLNDAAGTLIYAYDKNGKSYILVGKRVGHNWWGNLGGKADVGETFYQAAHRETKEESGDYFDFQNEIIYMPAHDMITVDEQLMTKRFRTYLAETKCIEPQELLNKLNGSKHAKEYTEFAWVPVEEVLDALNNPQTVTEENQPTIAIGKEGRILHPPFLQSLQQQQIKEWLEALSKGQEVPGTCTQSVAGHPELKPTNTQIDEPKSSADKNMALWLVESAKAAANKKIILTPRPKSGNSENKQKDAVYSIKSKSLKQPEKKVLPDCEPLPNDNAVQTAFLSMLKNLSGDPSAPIYEQIKEVVKKKSGRELGDEIAKLVEHIISQERVHTNKTFLYHGFEEILWFNCRVISTLRHMLDSSKLQTDVLRSMDCFFDDYQNANDLLKLILKGNDNYSDGFTRAGISCSPTLNLNVLTTLEIFITGKSVRPLSDPWSITETILESLGIPAETLMQNLKALYAQHFKGNSGVLLQFLLAPEVVNQACYISASLGKAVTDKDNKTVRQALPILQKIKTGDDPQLSVDTTYIEVRLHADLSKFVPGSVTVKEYFANPEINMTTIQRELTDLLSPYLFQVMEKLPRNGDIYNSNSPQTVQVLRKVMGVEAYEASSTMLPKIIKELRDKNYTKVVRLIVDDPSCLKATYTNPDSLKDYVVKDDSDISILSRLVKNLDPTHAKKYASVAAIVAPKECNANDFIKRFEHIKSLTKEKLENILNNNFVELTQYVLQPLFKDRTGDNYSFKIIALIGSIKKEDQADLIKTVQPLFKDTTNDYYRFKIIKYYGLLKEEDRDDLFKTVQPLLKDITSDDYRFNIIALIGSIKKEKRADLIKTVQPLLKDITSDYYRFEIIKYFKYLEKEDLEDLIKTVHPLFKNTTGDDDYRFKIIKCFGPLKKEDREDLFKTVQPLLQDITNDYYRFKIIKCFGSIKEDRADLIKIVQPLLKDITSDEYRFEIIKYYVFLKKEVREDLIKFVQPLSKDITSDNDSLKFIKYFGSHQDEYRFEIIKYFGSLEKEDRADLIKTVQPLLKDITSYYNRFEIIKYYVFLKKEDRAENTLDLLKKKIELI